MHYKRSLLNILSLSTIQTLKLIAVWQVKKYVNKMQEKDSEITIVWEKIIPVNGMQNICASEKRLEWMVKGHWKSDPKAHTGPMS